MTRTMVLGLLKVNGPMSGYEMQKMMESSQTDMWAYVKPASIYHALKKMQDEGKVILEKVEKTGLRTKSIFKITEDGEYELNQLLIDSFTNSSVVFPAPLYTALTFMENLNNEQILNSLEKQKQEITRVYDSMKAGYEVKQEALEELPDNVNIIFNNMYDQCELQLKTIEEIIKTIKGGK
ncbi:PadR family transcriptional regulator [Melghirimyces algeriensis]|uniref:Transcriptional regulator PadR-like family protein n=1 Tax=Melghirimyces algeriensis TaxID=910412 RepID=A0A521FG24_9BACL|nr:PadR family transcriptional regulator [Melghirimyces algeriensis]SMO95148.1 Transcriptional regulator PadR-like family protein [Melghirimyces algeriensis]